MNRPEVIMHNSVSLDGKVNGFEVDMDLHYGIVGGYGADIYFAGSNTAKTGIEPGALESSPETPEDFRKPERNPGLSYWVIPDTRGVLRGQLHVLRRFEYSRDIVILVSKTTDPAYIAYLKERDYDVLECGEDRVDYETAFARLGEVYGAKRILVDSGPILGGILLGRGLVDEISLLVHPVLVGPGFPGIFSKLEGGGPGSRLELAKSEPRGGGTLWTVWKIPPGPRQDRG